MPDIFPSVLIELTKVNIGTNRYVHKFKLSDGTVVTENTTQESYDNLSVKDSPRPVKVGTTWFMSSIRIGFDTPTGELDDNQYATQANGSHWVKLVGYDMEKILPDHVKNGILSEEGQTEVKKRYGNRS